MQSLSGQRVTVAGLGHFGGNIAAAKWLVQQGAHVLVTDTATEEKLADSLKLLAGLPIEYRLGEHLTSDFTAADLVVASPAIKPCNEFLAAAKNAGVPVTTEIRLFIERCPARVIGITGTKGKSTTTAMLGKILQPKFQTWVGGNNGVSLLADLPNITKGDLVVLELSSFMLYYLGQVQWSPHIALVTMLAVDHVDWHGTVEAYHDAKANLVRYQGVGDYAVLNEDDPGAAGLSRLARSRVIFYGLENRKRFALQTLGIHNQLNAQGAFAAAQILGVDWSEAQAALADFTGLPHRLEIVGEVAGVQYVNDSIATVPDAAIAGLDAFPAKKVVQIVGGSGKKLAVITALCGALTERAKAVLCIGETGAKIADTLEKTHTPNGAAVYRCGDLKTAMGVARGIATTGDVVLLSPGFASFDQFANFEQRGEAFRQIVREMVR